MKMSATRGSKLAYCHMYGIHGLGKLVWTIEDIFASKLRPKIEDFAWLPTMVLTFSKKFYLRGCGMSAEEASSLEVDHPANDQGTKRWLKQARSLNASL